MKQITMRKEDGKVTSVKIGSVVLLPDDIATGSFAVAPFLLKGLRVAQVDPGISFILRRMTNAGGMVSPYPVDVSLSAEDPLHVEILFSPLEELGSAAEFTGSANEIRNKDCFERILYKLGCGTNISLSFECFEESEFEWLDYSLSIPAERFDTAVDFIQKLIHPVDPKFLQRGE